MVVIVVVSRGTMVVGEDGLGEKKMRCRQPSNKDRQDQRVSQIK